MSGFAQRRCGRIGFAVLLLAAGMLGPWVSLVQAVCGTPPTVSFEKAALYAKPGGSTDYTVTITNNAAGSCNFDLSTSGDAAGFTSSLPDGTPFTVAGGATDTTTLRVAVGGAVALWTVNTTTLTVDSVNQVATTTVFDNSPLLHNSINLNSTKHGGNWGTSKAGAKYGAITCNTCHVKNPGNIKRVRTSITTPDNTLGDFPGNGQPISFLDARDGTSDFGNDLGGHATSNRICETCHSATKYHNYNTANNTGGLTHFNNQNCTACHAHNQGFKAGACDGCHGGGTAGAGSKNYWPDLSNARPENDTPGRHLEHMDALANLVYGLADAAALLDDPAAEAKQVDLCGYCHDTPGADADHSATLPAETAFHPVWNKAAAASGSYATATGNCTNICHNNHATGTGPGTWGWGFGGDAVSDCIMCHNDITVTANTTGNTHVDHTGAAADFGRNIVCADCHDGSTSWATSTKPASDHLNGILDIGGAVTLAYTGTTPPGTSYGSCNNNACHNDGTAAVGNPVNNTYIWSDNNLSDCGICHASLPTTNDHPSHINTAEDRYGSAANASWNVMDTNVAATNVYDFGCGQCHGDTLGNHLNGSRNLAGTGWNGSSCNATYCHSHKDLDGVTTVQVTTPSWGSGFPAGDRCAQCHENSPVSSGHEEHQVGFHYNAVYSGKNDVLPVNDGDPVPANLVNPGPNGMDQLRGHGGLLDSDRSANSTTMTCYVCHSDTVSGKGNDLNPVCATCHDGGTTAPNMGTMVVASTNAHVNGQIDVVFVNEKIRSKAQVRDDLFDVPELANNWTRVGGYKANTGASYDESPDTLRNMATSYGGWNSTDRTCMISCHLWETGRVDKYPVHWDDNSIHGSQPIMCIDCHTRLPK